MVTQISIKPMTDRALFSTTCKLYYKSLKSTLPICFILVALFMLAFHATEIFPAFENVAAQSLAGFKIEQAIMVSAILLLPLIGVIWLIYIQVVTKKPLAYGKVLSDAYSRLLPLLGCLISLCLLPAILIALFVVAQLFLLTMAKTSHAPWAMLFNYPWFLILEKVILGLLLLAILNRNLFAPVLVFSDEMSAESAIELSPTLVKHHWIKTYLYHVYGFGILILAYAAPAILQYAMPQLKWPTFVGLGISTILVTILLPWTLSFWLVRLWDLKSRQEK